LFSFSLFSGDLVLDVPDAPELLAMFITRAMVDDVLPPATISRCVLWLRMVFQARTVS
jgi:hypothetical protein